VKIPLIVSLVAGLCALPAVGQAPLPQPPAQLTPRDAPRFTAEVNLVNISFSVRDQRGGLIGNLGKDDFRLLEDRVAQQVRFFSSEQETPLTVGILIDRSGSQRGFEQENLYVALVFLKRVLRPQDQAFVIGFEDQIREACPPTNSLDRLDQVLRNFDKALSGAPRVGPQVSRSGGTAVFDSVYWSVKEKLEKVSGRKALIMIGDGRENSSKVQLADTIELLQNVDVIFYGLANPGNSTGQRDVDRMPLLTAESGGREFQIGAASLQRAFDEIEQELRTMYSIGYVSTNGARDGRFRRVDVRPVNPGYVVRARPGYYAR
jgi:Ca-activated chloride channel family protein